MEPNGVFLSLNIEPVGVVPMCLNASDHELLGAHEPTASLGWPNYVKALKHHNNLAWKVLMESVKLSSSLHCSNHTIYCNETQLWQFHNYDIYQGLMYIQDGLFD